MALALDLTPVVVLAPLVAFVVALVGGRYLPWKGALVGIAATGISLLLSLWIAATVAGGETRHETLYTWVDAETMTFTFGILVDPLSALMLVIVSLIAFLVHVFSVGYMNGEGETGLPRYYAELGLFTFSMTAFVVADNLLMAFIFFELVGLCSYLLIGFWFRSDAPPSAAKKAFLVTRFGDYFFLVGVVAIAAGYGTLAFAGDDSFVAAAAALESGETVFGLEAQTWITLTALLVLGGVIGKSAQFPLQTWLPDAMEGPTTVSALIHAATMVAAGVYLVARMFGYFVQSQTALAIVAFVGGFTALFAASMALVKDDIKQVLAYSTISQYGYMMLALGVGGYVAGIFHLMNHAFFKALLFLGAGAVIVLTHHTQDMRQLGGLKDRSPVTYWTFLAGGLALAGIVPLSGFWSKEEALYEALVVGLEQPLFLVAYAMALVAVFLTGLYTFRMIFLTFHGEPRSDHARDTVPIGWSIKLPLVVLGVLSVVAGVANLSPVEKLGLASETTFLQSWLDGEYGVGEGLETLTYSAYREQLPLETGVLGAETTTVLVTGVLSLGLAVAGALVAWRLYGGPDPGEPLEGLGSVHDLLDANYRQDELQVWLAEGLTVPVARGADRFDQSVVDGAVNGVTSVSLLGGDRVARIQTGVVSNYTALLVAGLVVLVLLLGVLGGWFL